MFGKYVYLIIYLGGSSFQGVFVFVLLLAAMIKCYSNVHIIFHTS